MIIFIIFIGWILCGVVSAGMEFAYFQGKYPDQAKNDVREDLASALGMGLLFGPLGLIMVFFFSGFAKYGWRLWPK